MIQAIAQILLFLVATSHTAYNALADFFDNPEIRRPLAELSGRLGLMRQFLRFFRFFDSFAESYNILTSVTGPVDSKQVKPSSSTDFSEKTLDGLSAMFNGLYLLFESATLVDALGIAGLAILGPELERAVKIESQRCWFTALAAGAFACFVRLSKVRVSSNVGTSFPKSGEEKPDASREGNAVEEKARAIDAAATQRRLTRKMVAYVLDMALPGSVIGWVPLSKGHVAVIMLVTSILTSVDVWERCRKQANKV